MEHDAARLTMVTGATMVGMALLGPTPAMARAGGDAVSPGSFVLGLASGAAVAGAVAVTLSRRGQVDEGAQDRTRLADVGMGMPSHGRHLRTSPAEGGRDDAHDEGPALGAHVATDYAEIAENYVRRLGVAERMAARAAGVRSTLVARIGTDIFDDLPVIERADGTVGDVGTGWWQARMGAQARSRPTIDDGLGTADTGVLAAPAATTGNLHVRISPRGASSGTTAAGVAPVARSAYIARKVAEVDIGAFPARRTSADLDVGDTFDQALAAMDERLGVRAGSTPPPVVSVSPVPFVLVADSSPVPPVPDAIETTYAETLWPAEGFADSIGDAGTIDDPSGIEQSTGFLPFRVPAGHPEVVDEDSYVDYLIADEFASNSSSAARRRSASYLRVIQGGANGEAAEDVPTMRLLDRPLGRHFRHEYDAVAL